MVFTGKQDGQYPVEIEGAYFNSGVSYALQVQAWVEWQGSEAEPDMQRTVEKRGG